MHRFAVFCGVALLVLACGGTAARAQVPDKFTNLKVLPKDMPKRELMDVMRNFTNALGVSCDHCHVEKDGADDFASDDKAPKHAARAMMQMAGEINQRLLPTAGLESPVQVRCITCHRGLTKPQTIDQVMTAEITKGGVTAATARYRELRGQYYGSGSYDFGPRPVNTVAETLARGQNNVDGALELLKLNEEFNADKVDTHLALGQLYAMKGNTDAAVASIERALKLDPGNERAKQMLERIRAPK